MNATADQLAARVTAFAVRLVRFCRTLPREPTTDVISKQLVRSGTSASANYRAARRGRSRAEFVAKLGLVVEEADESVHWLEIIDEAELLSGVVASVEMRWLLDESRQLRAIFSRSLTTARSNQKMLKS